MYGGNFAQTTTLRQISSSVGTLDLIGPVTEHPHCGYTERMSHNLKPQWLLRDRLADIAADLAHEGWMHHLPVREETLFAFLP